MKRVGTRELKNRLSAYMRRVRHGERLVVTDRGKPFAQITPIPEKPAAKSLNDLLQELETRGLVRKAKGGTLRPFKPVPSRGKSAAQMIVEDRR